MKVCHVTSAHPIDDVRIYHKECLSLYQEGYDVRLIGVITWKKIEPKIPYYLVSVKKINIIYRFFIIPFKILKIANSLDAELYHFHDPELLIIANRLKRKGKNVIFDVHEDVPRAILGRSWGNKLIRKFIALVYEYLENRYFKKFDGIISATPFINKRFIEINKNSVIINNYPNLSEIDVNSDFKKNKKQQICYSGLINQPRGVHNIIKALEYVDINFLLIGSFSSLKYKSDLESLNGWSKVHYVGYLSRDEMMTNLSESLAGIITFLPLPNHINSQPNKIFEYMSAGIPVIASNFPLWCNIIEKYKCGINVDPENSIEIANAIEFLVKTPDMAMEMGKNGKEAVLSEFNWSKESKKLKSFYKKILNE